MAPSLVPREYRHESLTISALKVSSSVEVKIDDPKIVLNAPESLPKALTMREQRGSDATWVSQGGLLRGGGI